MAYPPTPSRVMNAEEYELGPSQEASGSTTTPRRAALPQRRTLTLHPNQSSSAVLFSSQAHGATATTPRRVRRHRSDSTPLSPDVPTPRRAATGFGSDADRQAHFLRDDLEHLAPDGEEVQMPDFRHMLGFGEGDGDDHYAIAQGMKTRWKRKLYLLMEEPSSGREAFFVHALVTGAILFSAVLTTLSTLPSFHTHATSIRLLFGLDTTLVVLFTCEYLARTVAHSDSWTQYYNWSTSFFAVLDLIAILPYYIEVARQDDTSILFRFSILRTFRLLRVFRAFKYQNQMLLTIEVMYVAVRRSRDALVAITFFILLVLVLFSTLIYFAERGTWDANVGAFVDSDGDVSQFDSIPQTAWFALVTMSTVGYGDVVPKSALGKVLTVPLLMFGLLLIALPSFVLGRNFAIVFDAMSSLVDNMPAAGGSEHGSPHESPHLTADSLPRADERSSSPLLPTAAVPIPKHRVPSPVMTSMGSQPMTESASGSTVIRPTPRMWDGADDSAKMASSARERDLTNIKLAKNQLVLLDEIEGLKRTIERQGQMLDRVLAALTEPRSAARSDDVFGQAQPKRDAANGHDEDEQT